MSRQATAPAHKGPSGLWERVAYFALLGVPLLVPIVVFKVPFVVGPPLTLNPAVIPKLFVFALFTGVALTAWAVGAIREEFAVRSVPLKWWLAAFLGLSALSTIVGLNPARSFFGSGAYANGLVALLLAAALVFLVVQLVNTPERIRAISWATVAGGVVVGVVGLLQMVGADPMALGLKYDFASLRVGSLLGNSDVAGSYLVVPLLIAGALAFSAKKTGERVAASASFVVVLLCLAATGTRGAWLGALVGLVALGVCLLRGGLKVAKSAYVAVGGVVAIMLVWAALNAKNLLIRFADFAQGGNQAGGGRIPIWTDALRVIASHPLFGTGPDAYLLGWYGARAPVWVKAFGSGLLVDDPHNVVLLFGATLGIPATIAAVGLVALAVATGAPSATQRDATPSRRLYAGWWAALLGFAVTLLFALNTVTMMVMLFLCTGMVLTVKAKRTDAEKRLRYGLAIAAIALGLSGAIIGTLFVASDALLAAAQSQQQPADRIALLDKAAALAPWYGEPRLLAANARAALALAELQASAPTAHADAQVAETAFVQLVAFDPHELQYRVGEATFLVDAGHYLGVDMLNRALAAGQAATAINPGNPRAAYVLAAAQIGLSQPAAAVGTLAPLWDADSTYADAGVAYVQALAQTGDSAHAESVLATLKARFPSNAGVVKLESLLGTSTPTPTPAP